MRCLTLPPDSEILLWPRPNPATVPVELRSRYEDRVRALEAILKGSTLQAAGALYGVDRELLSKMLEDAQKIHLDGKPYGFRVCLPWTRTGPPVPRSTKVPLAAAPHALAQLFGAVPAAAKLVEDFEGALPERNRCSPAFDRLFKGFKRTLSLANLGHAFPLNTPDQGRRALLEWIKRIRRREMELDIARSKDEPVSVTRMDQVIRLQPFDRAEIDEHWTDVAWQGLVPDAKGLWHVVPLSGVWFIAMIDAVLPMCYAWIVVVGRSFNHRDFLRVQSKALTPWKRRDLILPGLEYHPDAWMPNAVPSFDMVMRPASQAMDNHGSHTGKVVIANVRDYQVGVINHGFSQVPEGRGNIEAFFHYITEAVFRKLAGGFRPARSFDEEAEKTSKLRPSDHPIEIEALEDLLDVHVSRFHVTTRPSLQNRTVRQVIEAQLVNGLWTTQSRLTENDAANLVAEHMTVKICGSERTQEQPHANFLDGIYRHDRLNKRWNLIGTKYKASVPFSDASKMTLYDDKGEVFAVLRARPPWSRPHTLEERRRAMQWRKRGIFKVDEDGDAVAAYHRRVRELASKLQWAADLFVKGQGGSAADAAGTSLPQKPVLPPDTMKGITPRGGHVGLMSRGKTK